MSHRRPFFRRLTLDIPADTAKKDRLEDTITLDRPHIVTGLLLHVPAGHEAEVPIWFLKNEGTWLPDNGGEIRLDATSEFPVINPNDNRDFRYAKKSTTYTLTGYNEDTVNSHELQAYIMGHWRGR